MIRRTRLPPPFPRQQRHLVATSALALPFPSCLRGGGVAPRHNAFRGGVASRRPSAAFYLYVLHPQKKNPKIFFPPVCLRLASSWSLMPAEVVRTRQPS